MARRFWYGALLWGMACTPAMAQEEAAGEQAEPDAFQTLTEGAETIEGLIRLYRKDQSLYAEIMPAQLDKNFIILPSIARGIGRGDLIGGMSYGFGDWVWTFRRHGDRLHVVGRNVRFRADEGSPESRALDYAYTDSVLYALDIAATSPSGGLVVDVTGIFMSDLAALGERIGAGFAFDANRSVWQAVEGYPENVEIEVAAVYASGGQTDLETVPDSRGVTIHVHYSISQLPENDYRPRLADDRIGYFLTVLKDYSDEDDDDRFIRYINRWDIRPADPAAIERGETSPPEEPLIFWIENTVPYAYRPYIRDGILEWNKAFEAIGIADAIEVRQQPDDADWDPEDVRYNTVRWMTSSAGFAIGPSRVNPLTGQILDADILFDADFITTWQQRWETMGPDDEDEDEEGDGGEAAHPRHQHAGHNCLYGHLMAQQQGLLTTALMTRGELSADGQLPMELIGQGLRSIVMHEVGHTLGLRHNFKASTWRALDELSALQGEATIASVMDYAPANIVPEGAEQGDYYPQTIGPYDYLAIEYGYRVIDASSTEDELPRLREIAAQAAARGLDFATDEDTYAYGIDPLVNIFDLGSDPLAFARRQMSTTSHLWTDVVERVTPEGREYARARQAFGTLMNEYWRSADFAAGYIGGIYTHRDHRGDPEGRPPFVPVEGARQREAMELLTTQVFSDAPFQFPRDLLNHLVVTRWDHWGMTSADRIEYPLHEYLATRQAQILGQLLSETTLARLQDSEFNAPAEDDVFTMAELFRSLTDAIFAELEAPQEPGEYTDRKPYISSLRRNVQRLYLERLIELTLEGGGAPDDARTLAGYHLTQLDERITALLDQGGLDLDDYSRAHLTELRNRIRRAQEARYQVAAP